MTKGSGRMATPLKVTGQFSTRRGPIRFPSLFITHGAPTLPIETGEARRWLEGLGRTMPRPNAVLCVSAHWETVRPAVSAAASPETIHDFTGFPDELYRMQYPAPGIPALAQRVQRLLRRAGLPCDIVADRGLDHGAWAPMKLIWPDADVPVIQLSVQTALGPGHHVALGRVLAPLRSRGVLVLASGSATHNLSDLGKFEYDDPPAAYVTAFNDWLIEAATEGRLDDLLHYRERAPEAARNHPTEEHLLPLFVALGAAMGEGPPPKAQLMHTSTTYGFLAMTSFAFGAG